MKLVFGINNFDNAGAENFMLRLAKYFSSTGHTIALFSLTKVEKEHRLRLNDIFQEDLVKIKIIEPFAPNKQTDFFLWKINAIAMRIGISDWRKKYIENRTKKKIVNFKPDIINSHLFETDYYFASSKLNIPHVISMHGPYEYYLHKAINDDGETSEKSNSQKRNLNKSFIEKADMTLNSSKNIIYCADKNLEIFQHISNSRIKTKKIYYGFEKKVVKKYQNKNFTIGMFARGVKSKGWEILIESFNILKPHYSNLNLKLIFSETEYMNSLQSKYSNSDIIFHGFESNIEMQIDSFDLIVFPTYYPGESLPNTIIESLMYNIPVISTFHAEIPKMIDLNGIKAGTVVLIDGLDFNEQVSSIAKAIETYLSNANLYNEHKKNCEIVSNQFEMETCQKKYLTFFEETIRQGKK